MTILTLPPLSHVSPPSIPEDNKNNLTLPPPTYEQPSTCKDNKSKMHSCNECSYTSNRMYNLKVHIKNKHENNKNEMQNNRAPVTMSIGGNVGRAPTSVFVGNNGPTAPTTMYTQPRQIGSNESGGVEVYQEHS